MSFVLLCPRRGEDVLAAEYDDFLHFTGLAPEELEQRPLETPDASIGSFEGIHGVFIGGSPFTITQPIEPDWQDAVSRSLVRFVADQVGGGIPVFSTCYGSSMLAHYLGGKVDTSFSESAGTSTLTVTPAGREDYLTRDLPEVSTVMTGHKDSVVELPPHATLLATGPTCPVQIYRLGDTVWVTQFHPEMDSERIKRRLSFYENEGYCRPDELAATYAAFNGHDTSAVNGLPRKFVEFCRAHSLGREQQLIDRAVG